MSDPLPPFNRARHRRHLDRAAVAPSGADFLKVRAAEDIADRLCGIMRTFPLAVDLGARKGVAGRVIASSDAAEKVGLLIEADLSLPMLAGRDGPRLVADEERLPFADASLDLVVSALALHWTNDLVGALIQIRRALKPDGLFLGAILGGGTLTELRRCLLAAEEELRGGAAMRVSPFVDTPDAAGLLQRAGFALPVADVDRVTVRYDHPLRLMADLRAMGETAAPLDRPARGLDRAVLARACELYIQRYAAADGRIPATFQIIMLTGWAPHEGQQKPLRPGSARMRLADALGSIEQSTGVRPGD